MIDAIFRFFGHPTKSERLAQIHTRRVELDRLIREAKRLHHPHSHHYVEMRGLTAEQIRLEMGVC